MAPITKLAAALDDIGCLEYHSQLEKLGVTTRRKLGELNEEEVCWRRAPRVGHIPHHPPTTRPSRAPQPLQRSPPPGLYSHPPPPPPPPLSPSLSPSPSSAVGPFPSKSSR